MARAAALVFATLALAPGLAAAASGGSIYVTSLPSRADVWVDGVYVGRSPAFVAGLSAGKHGVTLAKAGWTVRELEIGVSDGGIATSSTALAVGARVPTGGSSGMLVVRSMPPGAKVRLDGKPVRLDVGHEIPVGAGTHDLAFETSHGTAVQSVDVLPETTTTVLDVPQVEARHSGVVAPAEDYLPTDNFSVDGTKVAVRYMGHVVTGQLGDPSVHVDRATVAYDSAPELIGDKLYLPLALLQLLSGDTSK